MGTHYVHCRGFHLVSVVSSPLVYIQYYYTYIQGKPLVIIGTCYVH